MVGYICFQPCFFTSLYFNSRVEFWPTNFMVASKRVANGSMLFEDRFTWTCFFLTSLVCTKQVTASKFLQDFPHRWRLLAYSV